MKTTGHLYHLILSDQFEPGRQLELDLEMCQDLFDQIEMLKTLHPFQDDEELATFVIGLKMFSRVMVRYRDNPLFQEMAEAYRPFMMKLKDLQQKY